MKKKNKPIRILGNWWRNGKRGVLVRKQRRQRRSKNVINSVAVILIMLIFVGIIAFQIRELKKEDAELSAKEQVLKERLEMESKRTEELEQRRIYVQTKEYIEEEAKKLGLVYPEQIIFKPKDK